MQERSDKNLVEQNLRILEGGTFKGRNEGLWKLWGEPFLFRVREGEKEG